MKQVLSPHPRYFVAHHLYPLTTMFLLPLISFYFMSDVSILILILLLASEFSIFLIYLVKYLDMKCTSWEITDEQIISHQGIIARHAEYLELYRINDYTEHSSVMERILNIKSVIISSTDRSTPTLVIFGVNRDMDILSDLRQKVESSKLKRRIYEVSNY